MTRWLRFRLATVYLAVVLFLSLVAFRLVQLQVLPNEVLTSLVRRQFQSVVNKAPYRKPILDREGEELAVSMPASSVYARPRLIQQKSKTARLLAKILDGDAQKWYRRISQDKPFVWIQRQLSDERAKMLTAQKLPGIFVESENKRLYPNGMLAANVLGFTNIDGRGLEGIEFGFDEELTKSPNQLKIQRDGRGTPTYIERRTTPEEAVDGGLRLTLDRRIQHIVEEELDEAVGETEAKAVLAIVMHPKTGEIFGIGQRPSFDPNRVNDFPASNFLNRWVSQLYEPGSTMKVLLAAEAMERNLLTKNSLIDCGGGKLRFGDVTIGEAELNHAYQILPLDRVIRFSSNVGAARIANTLGADRVRGALDRFGLTRRTGVSLPGEISSSGKGDKFWIPVFVATVGFGQGVSVTPLQMVSAFAAFANGGYLVRPKILLSEMNPQRRGKLEMRRVLSPKTVATMRDILVSVTEEEGGTGSLARIPGVRIAGKTGTAQKYEPGTGYQGKKYFSSFIGFLPAEDPELVVGVMVDEPKKVYYASQVAVPLFRRIAERSMQVLDKLPRAMVAGEKFRALPEPTRKLELVAADEHGDFLLPDLSGLSMQEVMATLGTRFPNLKLYGSGYVVSQKPEPGHTVSSSSVISVEFSADAKS